MIKKLLTIIIALLLTATFACGGKAKDDELAAVPDDVFERPGQVETPPFFGEREPGATGADTEDDDDDASVGMSANLDCPEYKTVEPAAQPRLIDSEIENIRWEIKVTDSNGVVPGVEVIQLLDITATGTRAGFKVKCGGLTSASQFIITATAYDAEAEVEDEGEGEAPGMIASASMTANVTENPLRNKTFDNIDNPSQIRIPVGEDSANFSIEETASGGSDDEANFTFTHRVTIETDGVDQQQDIGSVKTDNTRTFTFNKIGRYKISSKVEDSASGYTAGGDDYFIELIVREDFTAGWQSRGVGSSDGANGKEGEAREISGEDVEIAFGREEVVSVIEGHADSYRCEFADGRNAIVQNLPGASEGEGDIQVNLTVGMPLKSLDGFQGAARAGETTTDKTCSLHIGLSNTVDNKIRLYKYKLENNSNLVFPNVKIKITNGISDTYETSTINVGYYVEPADIPLTIELQHGEDFVKEVDGEDQIVPEGTLYPLVAGRNTIETKEYKLSDYSEFFSSFRVFGGTGPYTWEVTSSLTEGGYSKASRDISGDCDPNFSDPVWRGLKYRILSSGGAVVEDAPSTTSVAVIDDGTSAGSGEDDNEDSDESDNECADSPGGDADVVELAGVLDWKKLPPDVSKFNDVITLKASDKCVENTENFNLPEGCADWSQPKEFKIKIKVDKGKKIAKTLVDIQVGRHADSSSDGPIRISFCSGAEFANCGVSGAALLDENGDHRLDGNSSTGGFYTFEIEPGSGSLYGRGNTAENHYEGDFRYFKIWKDEGVDDLLVQGLRVRHEVYLGDADDSDTREVTAYSSPGLTRWLSTDTPKAYFGPHDQVVTIITKTASGKNNYGTDMGVDLNLESNELWVDGFDIEYEDLSINNIGVTKQDRKPYFRYQNSRLELDWSAGRYDDREDGRETSYGDYTFDRAPFAPLWNLGLFAGENHMPMPAGPGYFFPVDTTDGWKIGSVTIYLFKPAEVAIKNYDNCYYQYVEGNANGKEGWISWDDREENIDDVNTEFLKDGEDNFRMSNCNDSSADQALEDLDENGVLDVFEQINNPNTDHNSEVAIGGYK